MAGRPGWNDYFLNIARDISARSTCPGRSVGCVVIDPETKHILSTGYNGAPRGTAHCTEACAHRESGSDFRKCRALHAELNAVINAAFNGVKLKGSIMYLTTTPCVFCSRAIINAGVKEVIASSKYPHDDAIDLLNEGGVKVQIIQGLSRTEMLMNAQTRDA